MSFPRYPKYKASGVEWLGDVPEHWDVGPIKWVIQKIESGTSVNASDEPAESGKLGVLKTSCVYTGKFDATENKTVIEEDAASVSCPLKPGTLIVSRMNTPDLIGAAGVVTVATENLFLPDRLWQISFANADAHFVHFWTLTSLYRGQVRAVCTGTSSSMKNLGQDQFRSFNLALPPLPEQTRIATFLDQETAKIDELVAEQRRLMELLKEKRQAVISHAVTKGLNPDAPLKPSGIEWLGDVPAHWKVTRLCYYATIENGTTPNRENPDFWDGGVVPWLSSGEVNQYHINEASEFITKLALEKCSLRMLPQGTVVVGMIGQGKTRGQSAVLEFEACINQNLAAIVPGDQLDSYYLLHVFQSVYDYLREFGRGGNQAALNSEILSALTIPIPPLDEQQGISLFLLRRLAEFALLTAEAQRAIDLLQERRTALISAAVTGQIDVRGFVVAEAA
jgi:type I restriction enzyme, S subunit